MLLAMPISATAAFSVLATWKVWKPAAAIGGLMYGFSPYMVGQALGHVELLFLPLPPLIALTVSRILQSRGSPRRTGIALGVLLSAQFLIAPEIFATVCGFVAVAVVCVAIRNRPTWSESTRVVLVPTGLALGTMIVLLAYPAWMLLAGPQHFTGPTWDPVNPFHNDLLSFVIPGPLQKVSLGMGSLWARVSAGAGATEAGGYIGGPVLALGAVFAWRSRHSQRTQLALVLVLFALVLSLGPRLAVNGAVTRIPLPFGLLDHLPLFDDVLPSRINFEVTAFLGAIIAFGIDDLHQTSAKVRSHSGPRRTALVVALITLATVIVIQLPRFPMPTASLATVSFPVALRDAIPPGDPIAITYPYDLIDPMLWQTEDDFGFRLQAGYAYHPTSAMVSHPILGPSFTSPRDLQRFLGTQEDSRTYGRALSLSPGLVSITRLTLSRYHIRLIVVDRAADREWPSCETL